MFKHCLSKFSCALIMMCAVVTGGLFQSCQDVLDEYKYDDSEPSWLGASIYDFLKEGNAGHTYNNYVRLIDDLGEKDILSRTGSRTLFIADDAAFERFYEENSWGVKSYEDFTFRQKKVLLYNAMLKNAYLLDMMAATTVDPNVEQLGGDCMRRETSATLFDSVPLFSANSTTQGLRFPQNNPSFKLWEEYLEGDSIRIAIGSKNPMMVHFLYEFVRTNNIQDEDFTVMFQRQGKTRTGTEAFVFGNKILNSDVSYGDLSDDTLTITCKNGYLYRMDDVLVPPSNMAQVLRETKNTKLFSRMLDRFAYLEYDASLTSQFNALYHENKPEDNENVYLLKYALSNAKDYYTPGENGTKDKATKKSFGTDDYLRYDPGDAQYNGGNGLQKDMAAMLVPNDEMVYRFFAPERFQNPDIIAANYVTDEDGKKVQSRPYGVGSSIVEEFSNPDDVLKLDESLKTGDDWYAEAMAPCLDSIGLDVLKAFLDNLMHISFVQTIPSNFDKVKNDARDEMGLQVSDVEDCIIANNGIIYILNNVFGPALYQSVMAPPYVLTNMRIMKRMILDLEYEAYLLAMDSKFSFIVPEDSCFVYYDPTTLKSTQPTAWVLGMGKINEKDTEGVIYTKMEYNPETYELMDTLETGYAPKSAISDVAADAKLKNRLQDLMEYFIIVDEVENTENEYFLSKGYGTIKCVKEADGTVKFQGGEQLEMSNKLGRDVNVTIKGLGRYQEKNGVTYCTESKDEVYKSGVVSPPTRSISSYLSNNSEENPFYEFYKLCSALSYTEMYGRIFDLDEAETEEKEALLDSINRYRVFAPTVSGQYALDEAVPFFSTYHYTVYVPQASALQQAYEDGLPQLDDILAEVEAGNYGRAASMIRLVNKFARYHFQDNSVMVDKLPFSVVSANVKYDSIRYETAAIDDQTGRFYDLLIKSDNGTITVKDGLSNIASVKNEAGKEGKTWNVLTRDLLLTGDPTMGNPDIATSSFAVVHSIDKVLYNKGMFGYDGKFRRFAKDGEIVDKINIAVPTNYIEANDSIVYAEKEYTIGQAKAFMMNTADGEIYQKTGYLMKELAEAESSKFVKEDYILLGDTAKILITDTGFLIDTLGTGENKIRFLWTNLQPLSVDTLGNVSPDSIVTVLPDGTFVNEKGVEIK